MATLYFGHKGRPRNPELPRSPNGTTKPHDKRRRALMADRVDELRLRLGFGILSANDWDLLTSVSDELRRLERRAPVKERVSDEKPKKERVYSQSDAARFQRNWRAANPERSRATDNRRRDLERGGVTKKQIRAWADTQTKVCRWCRGVCADEYHVDHIVPLARGGAHQINNLCIACPPCNRRKGAQYPEEFELKLLIGAEQK